MSARQVDYDLVIIGGGAAGLTAAQYGARAALKTLVIEQAANGGQCLLIEGLENYPGFPEPINGTDFTERFEEQARNFGAEFKIATVQKIEKSGNSFTLTTDAEDIRASAVILATGAKHRTLDVPGEAEFQGKGVSYCATCDGPFFKGQRILVVGGGDAAFDEANFLSKLSDKVVLVHRRESFRAQKSLVKRVMDNPNIEVRTNTVVKEVTGAPNMFGIEAVDSITFENTITGEVYSEPFKAMFVFVGSIPQTSLAENVEKDEAGYIVTDDHMRTSLEGLYAVGDVRTTPFRQLVVAASDGAIAAHDASAYIDAIEEAAGAGETPEPALV